MLTRLNHYLHLGLLIALTFTGVGASQPAGVTMTVEPFFDGHFKFGEWLPLRVTLANDGPPLNVEVRADTAESGGQTIYSLPVDLPTGARKRITLYVQPPSFARAIRVRLVDGARELDSQPVSVTVERNVDYLIGVIAPREAPFVPLKGLTLDPLSTDQLAQQGWSVAPAIRIVKLIQLSMLDVPDRFEGLRLLDALVISGEDTSGLTTEQVNALQSWVEQGGRLILGGGATAARTLAGLPDVLVGDFRSTDGATNLDTLDALGAFAEEDVRVPGPFVATWPASGQTLIPQPDGRALLVERRFGEGHVNYVALDLAASPFDAWAGTALFWEKLLTPGSTYPVNAPPDVSLRVVRASSFSYALQNLPALDLPSIRELAGLLVLYVVIVGPINYLVLRRLRKLVWGWFSIGALTVLFSVGAFTVGHALRGSEVIINKVSVLTFGVHGTAAPVQSYVGLFSPERRAYTLNFPGHVLVAPLTPEGNTWGGVAPPPGVVNLAQGEPAQARDVQVNQWTLQGFQTESPAPEGWGIESDLVLDGSHLRGTLVNHTSETVWDTTVIYGNRFMRLGELPAGETRSVDLSLQTIAGSSFPYFLFEDMWQKAGPNGPPRDLQLRQQLLENYFTNLGGPPQPPARPTLIGWLSSSPLDIQVDGVRWATQQTSLLIAELGTRYPSGPISLPPGSISAQLSAAQGDAGVCGPQANQVYMNNGSATLDFQLAPELADLRVTQLAVVVNAGGQQPAVEIYTQAGEWIEVEVQEGDNPLPDPARFILAGGVVRLRINSQRVGGCWLFDLNIEGVLPGSNT